MKVKITKEVDVKFKIVKLYRHDETDDQHYPYVRYSMSVVSSGIDTIEEAMAAREDYVGQLRNGDNVTFEVVIDSESLK